MDLSPNEDAGQGIFGASRGADLVRAHLSGQYEERNCPQPIHNRDDHLLRQPRVQSASRPISEVDWATQRLTLGRFDAPMVTGRGSVLRAKFPEWLPSKSGLGRLFWSRANKGLVSVEWRASLSCQAEEIGTAVRNRRGIGPMGGPHLSHEEPLVGHAEAHVHASHPEEIAHAGQHGDALPTNHSQ